MNQNANQRQASGLRKRGAAVLWLGLSLAGSFAEATNLPPLMPTAPDIGLSFIRVLTALAFVLALFFGGVWLFRNGHRWMGVQRQAPKLNVLEARSLGGRQAIYVVGYEQERMLIASSPAGVTLLTHLPQADEDAAETPKTKPPTFLHALQSIMAKK